MAETRATSNEEIMKKLTGGYQELQKGDTTLTTRLAVSEQNFQDLQGEQKRIDQTLTSLMQETAEKLDTLLSLVTRMAQHKIERGEKQPWVADPGRKPASPGYHPLLKINSPIPIAELAPTLQHNESGQKQQQTRIDSSLPPSSAPVAAAESGPRAAVIGEHGQKQPVHSAPSLPFYTTPQPSPFPPFESLVPFQSSLLQQSYYSPYDQHQTSHNYAPSTSSISAKSASDLTLSSNSQHSSEQYAPFGSSVSHVHEDPYENAVKFNQGSGFIDGKYASYNQSKSGFGLDLYGRRMDNGVTCYESSYDDGYRDCVFAYQGGKVVPYGARGISPNSSTWTELDDYERPISFPAGEEPSSGSSKIVRATPKADTQEDFKGEIKKISLAGDNSSSDLDTLESDEDAARGESEYEVDMDKDEVDDMVYEGDAPVETVPETEKETHLLAVSKMDWRYIKPEYLYVMLSSFLPKGGQILFISIYPSGFGLQRMKGEKVHGQVGSGEMDDEILLSYELSRLRWYYAVVECDSIATADHLYQTCDGVEFDRSSNILDLRFIPDSVELKHPPRDIATLVPENYEAIDFHTYALQKSKVDSSLGEDLPDEYKWADFSLLTRLPRLSLILIKAALGSSWKEILCGEQILEGKMDHGCSAVLIVSLFDVFKTLNYKSTRKKKLYYKPPQLCIFLDGRELLKTLQRGISIASREEEGKGEECSSSPVGENSGLPHICFAGLSEDKATLIGEHITYGVVIENLNAEVVKAVMLVDSAQICEDTIQHGKDNVCGLDVSASVSDAAKCELHDVSESSIELRKKLNGLENTERMAMEEIEKLRLHCKSVEAKDEEHLATIDERRRELDLVKRKLAESEEKIANLESKTHEILQEKEEEALEKGGLELMIEELKINLKQLNSTEMSLTGAKKLMAAKILELEKNLHKALQNNPDMVIEIKKLAGKLKKEKKAIQMLINKHDSLESDLNWTREQSKGAAYKIENLIREKEMEEEKVKEESTILDLQRELGELNVDLVRLDDKCRVEEEKSKQLITKVNHRSSVLGRMTLGKEHATTGLDAERIEAEKLRLELSSFLRFFVHFILEDKDILRGRICHDSGLVMNYRVGLPRKRRRAQTQECKLLIDVAILLGREGDKCRRERREKCGMNCLFSSLLFSLFLYCFSIFFSSVNCPKLY